MLRRSVLWLAFVWHLTFVGAAFGANPFAGAWVGDWSGGGQRGRIYATINSAGAVSGYVLNSSTGNWGSVSGSVNAIGGSSFNIYYNGGSQVWNGKLVQTARNLRMSVLQTSTGSRIVSTLKPDAFGGAERSPANSVGAWSGVWSGNGQSGTIQFTIDTRGNVNGTTTSGSGQSGTLDGSITPQGDFFGWISLGDQPRQPIVTTFVPNSPRLSTPFAQRVNSSTTVRGTLTLKSGPLPDTGPTARVLGRWAGTWRNAAESGTILIVVYSDGSLSGSIYNNNRKYGGQINGQATGIGSFIANITYKPPGGATVVTPAQGTIVYAGSRFVGTFSQGGMPGKLSLQRKP